LFFAVVVDVADGDGVEVGGWEEVGVGRFAHVERGKERC
jgi:hypothetical protein